MDWKVRHDIITEHIKSTGMTAKAYHESIKNCTFSHKIFESYINGRTNSNRVKNFLIIREGLSVDDVDLSDRIPSKTKKVKQDYSLRKIENSADLAHDIREYVQALKAF